MMAKLKPVTPDELQDALKKTKPWSGLGLLGHTAWRGRPLMLTGLRRPLRAMQPDPVGQRLLVELT